MDGTTFSRREIGPGPVAQARRDHLIVSGTVVLNRTNQTSTDSLSSHCKRYNRYGDMYKAINICRSAVFYFIIRQIRHGDCTSL
jgi:hypothetical protein